MYGRVRGGPGEARDPRRSRSIYRLVADKLLRVELRGRVRGSVVSPYSRDIRRPRLRVTCPGHMRRVTLPPPELF